MLDPLSALSLAGNVAQILDFICTIVSEARQISSSTQGASAGNIDLQNITQDLHSLLISLEASERSVKGQQSANDTQIRELAMSAKDAVSVLLNALQSLQVRGAGIRRKVHSVRQALRTVWKEKQINNLEKRLESYRSQISLRIVTALRFGLPFALCKRWTDTRAVATNSPSF